MTDTISFILLDLIAGTFSGLIGIDGGIIIVTALVLLFGFSRHMAQDTTLALPIPPIGLLAVLTYYKSGFVDFQTACLICLWFFLGASLVGDSL
jgi:uncharacterized membrane protein YfcA